MLFDAGRDGYVEDDDDMMTMVTMTFTKDLNSFRNNSTQNTRVVQLSPCPCVLRPKDFAKSSQIYDKPLLR